VQGESVVRQLHQRATALCKFLVLGCQRFQCRHDDRSCDACLSQRFVRDRMNQGRTKLFLPEHWLALGVFTFSDGSLGFRLGLSSLLSMG
jgi:hypothetical protein